MDICKKREMDLEQAVLRAAKEISDVGFVLGKIAEAIEEHERGDEV